MSDRFSRLKVIQGGKTNNNLDLEQLEYDHNEIKNDGEGYILVYKSHKEKSYIIMSNGFTNEEGIYASHIISKGIMEGSFEDMK